ncbi:MAG: hypothetical protein Q9187_001903 [Circinaria calcarea]
MEETNYHRALSSPAAAHSALSTNGENLRSQFSNQEAKGTKTFQNVPSIEQGEVVNHEYKKKTYIQKLALFRKSVLRRPNRLAGMWFNVLNGTTSLILGGKPYHFASSMVGLSYLSPLLGVFVGSAYAGKLGDRVVLWLARRNGGIMESEYRLWMFTASLILVPGSLLLWGVGAAHGIHWFGLVFAMGVIAVTNTIGLQVSVAYCIDSYRSLSGEAVVSVILNAFIVAACAGWAQVVTFLLVVKYGKRMRRASMRRYNKYVEQMARAGLTH